MKKLPIGIQTFEEIIKKDYLYVDKTKQIHEIITTGKTYFLSRPRRFGKSLLCSTLEEIFKGNKELFKGLWIYDSDYNWKPHPVIRISMPKTIQNSPEQFEKWLNEKIEELANENSIPIDLNKTLQTKFSILVKKLSQKNKVVIIIDEYDKPILDNITNIKFAEKMREILSSFYATFKDLDEYLEFIFITGVTKFAKTSIFSGLNNLRDLTFHEKASTLLGYTQKELEFYFKEQISRFAKKKQTSKAQILFALKNWYNGYRFVEYSKKVYNPFSILLVLDEFKFKNYWFETGTPTFLVNLMKDKVFNYSDPKSFEISERQIGNFDISNINIKTLLFQTGYLTIDRYEHSLQRYYLKYPNKEVKESLLEVLLEAFTGIDPIVSVDMSLELIDSLKDNDLKKFIDILCNFFASIPYAIQINHEKYYQSIFFMILTFLDINIHAEEQTNIGRIDSVVETKNFIYIFEFKVNKNAAQALQQIEDKKYYQKYMSSKYKNKKIIAVGINFDTKEKNISEFEEKVIN